MSNSLVISFPILLIHFADKNDRHRNLIALKSDYSIDQSVLSYCVPFRIKIHILRISLCHGAFVFTQFI